MRRVCAILGLVWAMGAGVEKAGAENYGFGLLRHDVIMERRLVPEVQLSNVSIDVVFPSGGAGLDVGRFRSQLESDIARGGQNIFLNDKNPIFDIRLTVTSFDRPRVERKAEKNGTSYNKAGSATMVLQLVHHTDGQVIFSSTESYVVGESEVMGPSTGNSGGGGLSRFHINLPQVMGGNTSASERTTDDSVALEMINGLATKIASHLVLTAERVTIPLAKGPGLDEPDKLAEAKRWNEDLEALSTMAPAGNSADDAYRSYDIGVADEALGYASEDPKTTLKFLDAASVQYTKAIEGKATEKYFRICQDRIEKAIERYTKQKERNEEAARLQAGDAKQEHAYAERKKAGAIDNTDVIKMVQARVDPALITMQIRTAPEAYFNVTTSGLIELSRSGVPSPIIVQMTQRMQGQAAKPAVAGSR